VNGRSTKAAESGGDGELAAAWRDRVVRDRAGAGFGTWVRTKNAAIASASASAIAATVASRRLTACTATQGNPRFPAARLNHCRGAPSSS